MEITLLHLYAVSVMLIGIQTRSALLVLASILFVVVSGYAREKGVTAGASDLYGMLVSLLILLYAVTKKKIEHFKKAPQRSKAEQQKPPSIPKPPPRPTPISTVRRQPNKIAHPTVLTTFNLLPNLSQDLPPSTSNLPSRFNSFSPSPCAVYFTPLTEECDHGVLNQTTAELMTTYHRNRKDVKMIQEEQSRLPAKGVCKLTLDGWFTGSNAPILNAVDPTNANRGSPTNWAFCFKEVSSSSDMDTIKSTLHDMKALSLNPTPVTSAIRDGVSYARLAFRNFNYADVRADVCDKINTTPQKDQVLPYVMIGFTIVKPNTIHRIDGYRYENNTLKVDSGNLLNDLLSKLYEEVMLEDKKYSGYYNLELQPKSVQATIYKLGTNSCGKRYVMMFVPGRINLYDFGASRWILYSGISKEEQQSDPVKTAIQQNKQQAIEQDRKIMLRTMVPYKKTNNITLGIPPNLISDDGVLYVRIDV